MTDRENSGIMGKLEGEMPTGQRRLKPILPGLPVWETGTLGHKASIIMF